MKNLLIVIALISIALFSSCKKEQTIANRFVIVGDYTFEMLTVPDVNGDFRLKILNINDSVFNSYQNFNDGFAWARINDFEMLNSMEYSSQKIITINQTSGLSLYPRHPETEIKPIITLYARRIPEPGEVKIFESASNFFGIY